MREIVPTESFRRKAEGKGGGQIKKEALCEGFHFFKRRFLQLVLLP